MFDLAIKREGKKKQYISPFLYTALLLFILYEIYLILLTKKIFEILKNGNDNKHSLCS